MTDYFVNVAARLLFPERCVRPRMSSVFESSGRGDAERNAVAPGGSADAGAEASDRPPRAPLGRPAESAAPASRLQTAVAMLEPPSDPVDVGPGERDRHERRQWHGRTDRESFVDAPQARLAEDGDRASGNERGDWPQTAFPAERSALASLADRESSTPSALVAAIDRPPAVDVVAALTAPRPELVPASAALLRSLAATAPLAPSPLGSQATDGAARTAPAVHVTIGRVEVRVPPASRTPRAQPSVPAGMTLGEYLRQRSGSGPR